MMLVPENNVQAQLLKSVAIAVVAKTAAGINAPWTILRTIA